ncbi:lysophospholipase L1-like esterase [Kordia periserrulae]|uniref:Lysophospholipase L1-like esterase n=1 Tax=Kordia periserrulae TaxID=701523 RepID=A0A2T6C155_9FLAO|nr:SGNH/GDSL hydrolase family protein [Kordia periserrulae]PTX61967.1 lysophospholipase L1-like esterase [Kordia periserrulae]
MKIRFLVVLLSIGFFSCTSDDGLPDMPSVMPDVSNEEPVEPTSYQMLSLGDSYTIGQSVCETCRFPEQLKEGLAETFPVDIFSVQVVAQTGWTTTNLLNAIESENLSNNYDLVTLLIGVNNQFQGRPFSLYETEFPALVTKAITLANGDADNVIVVSIPDYAYTPFGQAFGNPAVTSAEIDQYNAFANDYCDANGISFVNITDITRQGLENTALVAEDNLHLSELAYSLFVERLLPVAIDKLQ